MERSRLQTVLSAVLPVLLLAGLLMVFFKKGPLGVFRASLPPIEKVFIRQVTFYPEEIRVDVVNDGPEQVTIAQLLLNNAYWQFEMTPGRTLRPLERGRIKLAYPWVEGEPLHVALLTRSGLTFETTVEAATLTPTMTPRYLRSFVALGVYVGVLPVLVGLLWFPFLSALRGQGYDFLLALTVGLLVFLGFDALAEAVELVADVPNSYNAVGILVLGLAVAVLTLAAVSNRTQRQAESRGPAYQAVALGYLIALGIGLHNLGEGLAIGSAYAIGEIALGSTLVVGFMVHNVTEGVAIVAPLARSSWALGRLVPHLVAMGLLAGAPTIAGTILGGLSYSATLAVAFLAVGAGAIFDVAFDILHQMTDGRWRSLWTVPNTLGFLSGLAIMYATGLLVVG